MGGGDVVLDASHQGGLFHVNSSDSVLVLEGLVLRNAQSPAETDGGAVNVTAGALRATSCAFASNNASRGSAIGTHFITRLELSGCNFTDNWGMAILVQGLAATITVTDSHFNNNGRDSGYGAISVQSDGTLMTIARSTFTSHINVAVAVVDILGGVFEKDEYIFTDCIFANNIADSAAVQIMGASSSVNTPIRASFIRCDFTNNTGGAAVGALSLMAGINGTTYELTNCTFTGNTGDSAGAIYMNPFSPYPFSTTITDCTFADNQCTDGTCVTYIDYPATKVYLPAGGAIQVINYADDSANASVRIVNTQFRAQATAANATSDTTAAAGGYNDIFQNNTFGGMVQFCCPSPSPPLPHSPPHSSDSSSTARADDDTKCVLMPTSFLLVSQLPPAQKIVHC
jgi:hypothetical protein